MTKRAYIWTIVSHIPFWTLYMLLPFILLRDLGANLWHITLLMTLRPVVSIFSAYWSAHVKKRSDRLVSNVVWGWLLAHIPFLLFPWVNGIYFVIAASTLFMVMQRGVIPAWMEIFRINLSKTEREKLVAYTSALSYGGSIALSFFIGALLDAYVEAWRYLFPITAILSLSAILLQLCIRVTGETKEIQDNHFTKPWSSAQEVLSARPDYKRFQLGFMLGGFGLMIFQPALPQFFVDVLHFSHKDVSVAINCCKGLGYVATTGLWARWVGRANFFRFSALVSAIAMLFPLGLIMGQVFISYLIYGIMQAGSELSWRLSGPHFAPDEDSSSFTSVNVLAIGLRGIIAIPLGALILMQFGPMSVMLISSCFCLASSTYLFNASKKPVEAPGW